MSTSAAGVHAPSAPSASQASRPTVEPNITEPNIPELNVPEPNIPNLVVSAADHPSIQQAIDACASLGGGTVTVPEGVWHTGPLHLKSRIRLNVEAGARVEFSADREDYLPPVFTRWEGLECWNYSPLVYARDCEDVALTGEGELVGHGEAWWDWKRTQAAGSNALYDMAAAGVPVDDRVFGTEEAALRPSFVQFIGCRRVLIEGVTVLDGPQWTLHPVYCDDVVVRGVTVRTAGPNTDGLNPDSCANVLIERCSFDTGDDCIAVNAGMNEDGWRVGRPCENIVIRDCAMTGGHAAIAIGSAVSGGIGNVHVHDCTMRGVMRGVRVKSMRGRGGYVSDLTFERLSIRDVDTVALDVNMFYDTTTVEPKSAAPTDLERVAFRDIDIAGAPLGICLKGLPERPLEGIVLDDIRCAADDGMTCTDVEGLAVRDVACTHAADTTATTTEQER
ncbi:glycoside hydrolase family 28 protein [Bifidobacterium avesanii]|nr:glycoside hydrolase family 28 protein [Bifidobacterium avesanii]KAB8294452.1 glycoside hydrolase family protein [Bifidobacterium avesanii]